MKANKFKFYLYRYILITFIFIILFLSNSKVCKVTQQNMAVYFLLNYGGINLSQSLNAVEFIKFLVPNLFVIFIFSDIMRSESLINYVYVFTRLVRKQQWLFQKTIQLFFQIFSIYFWLFILSFFIGQLSGITNIELSRFISLILPLFLLNVLTIFEFIFLQNILSMRNGSTVTFVIIAFIYVIPMVIVSLMERNYNPALYLILPANQMYLWHGDRISVDGTEMFFSNPIEGFSLLYSLIILLISIAVSYQMYLWFFIRNDMSEIIKE